MPDLLEMIEKAKKKQEINKIESKIIPEVKKAGKTPSAKLNLIKYLYADLTGESTTGRLRKNMKTAVINELSKF